MVARSAPLAALVAALWFGFQAAPAAAQGMKPSDALALRGAGSTFASLLYKKWIDAYRAAAPNVTISYDPVGSGEGIARFLAETVDFAGRDVPLSEAEMAKVRNGVAMMPTLAGMIVLAYNVPGLSAELKLPRDVYADIFAGAIKHWDDPRIRAANPGQNLPHLDIVLVAGAALAPAALSARGAIRHAAIIGIGRDGTMRCGCARPSPRAAAPARAGGRPGG